MSTIHRRSMKSMFCLRLKNFSSTFLSQSADASSSFFWRWPKINITYNHSTIFLCLSVLLSFWASKCNGWPMQSASFRLKNIILVYLPRELERKSWCIKKAKKNALGPRNLYLKFIITIIIVSQIYCFFIHIIIIISNSLQIKCWNSVIHGFCVYIVTLIFLYLNLIDISVSVKL